MTHASYPPECTVSQWQRNTAGAKHAHQACDANALKTAQRYKEQVRTVKIIPPGGIASGPHCISNLLHTVLLKKQQKLEVESLYKPKKHTKRVFGFFSVGLLVIKTSKGTPVCLSSRIFASTRGSPVWPSFHLWKAPGSSFHLSFLPVMPYSANSLLPCFWVKNLSKQ